MLNPSVGNETCDDKTIKRLIFFTKKFGYGGFYVGNIFPNINTKVNDLYLDVSHDEKKNSVTEELVLYCFLGVFVIFIVDSFTKAGKYVR